MLSITHRDAQDRLAGPQSRPAGRRLVRRVLLFLSVFTLAGALSAVTVWFTSLPSSANSGEGYYVEAAGWVGWYGGDLSVWKNGQWHTGTNGWDWLAAGNWSTDHGAQNVEYWAETWDWMIGESAFALGYVSILSAPSNQAPTPWVEIDGYGSGAVYTRPYGQNGSVTVRYKTTDADSNLWGIRPQVWHPGSGLFTNDGGAWTGAGGGYAEIVRSIALDRDGDWYFWTDAQDTPGVFANSGAWDGAYRLHVVQGAPPNTPPTASVVVDGQSHGATVTRPYGGSVNVTVRYRANDANGNLSGIRPQVWRPDGNLNNNGGVFVPQSGSSGEVAWTVNLHQDGNWYFWSDAQDPVIAPGYTDSGAWTSGFRLNVTQGADTTPPGTPLVSLSLIAAESFTATWNNPGDNAGVTGYQWHLNGGTWTDTTANTHAFSSLAPNTTYNVEVRAKDAANNWSNIGSALATTSGSGGGGTTTGQSFYADVDGDGLYDEIVRPGTADFNYRITAWYTESVTYRNIFANNFWSLIDIFWAGGTPADNIRNRPAFTPVWLHTPAFWQTSSTYFRASFTFTTLPGERVGLFQDVSEGPNVNPGAWEPLLNPTIFSNGGAQSIIPPQFDADLFAGSKFVLVKFGTPVGSVQIRDSAGGVLADGVGINGNANISLPANSLINLSLRNTIGQIVSEIHRVVWRILSTSGAVLREGTDADINVDNISLGQIARIAILLDNAAERSINVSIAPSAGYREEQVWISDWPWKEFVADEEGDNGQWVDRVTPGHWITTVLPTARSAPPGPWTVENMVLNPTGYYYSDPVKFLGMLPDWNWKNLITQGDWGDWTIMDSGSFLYGTLLAHPELLPPPPVPLPDAPPNPQTNPPDPAPGSKLIEIVFGVAIMEQITRLFEFSYILYDKPHKTLPGKFYSGRSFGPGSPSAVLKKRDAYHTRNVDHGPAALKAYIRTRGFSTYAERAQWGREQQMIDFHGGFVPSNGYLLNLTNSTNARREVGKKNMLGYTFWLTSNHAFGPLAPYSGHSRTIPFGFTWPVHGHIVEIKVLP